MRNTALVLSGGGSKGAFQAGAIKYLVEKGVKFNVIAGTSVGALNGLIVSQQEPEKTPEELNNWWTKIRNRDVYRRHNFWKRLGKGISHIFGQNKDFSFLPTSIYDNSPLRKLIEEYIDLTKIRENVEHFFVSFVSLQTGKVYSKDITTLYDKKEAVDYVIASTLIPMAFPPFEYYIYDQEIEDIFSDEDKLKVQQYVDGGVLNKTPLSTVLQYDVGVVYIINNFPRYPNINPKSLEKKYKSFFSVGLRSVSNLAPNGHFERDIRDAGKINNDIRVLGKLETEVVRLLEEQKLKNQIKTLFDRKKRDFTFVKSRRTGREKKEVKIVGIYPDSEIEVYEMEFNPQKSKALLELGFKTAQRILSH